MTKKKTLKKSFGGTLPILNHLPGRMYFARFSCVLCALDDDDDHDDDIKWKTKFSFQLAYRHSLLDNNKLMRACARDLCVPVCLCTYILSDPFLLNVNNNLHFSWC